MAEWSWSLIDDQQRTFMMTLFKKIVRWGSFAFHMAVPQNKH